MQEQETKILGGRVSLIQPAKGGYRVGIDPVFLAAALPVSSGVSVADFGCGSGAAMLCLAERCRDITITGIECDDDFLNLAKRNIMLNHGEQKKIRLVKGDLADQSLQLEPFDYIMTNPPFYKQGTGIISKDKSRRQAKYEQNIDITGWVQAAFRLLTSTGSLLVIYLEKRKDDLLKALKSAGFQSISMVMLHPAFNRQAKRFLALARKPVAVTDLPKGGIVTHAPFYLHRASGGWTKESHAILYDGKAYNPWAL